MSPCLSFNNGEGSRVGHSEHCCKFQKRSPVFLPYFSHLNYSFVSKLRQVIRFSGSFFASRSTLINHVLSVFFLSSWAKVMRVTTPSGVNAGVKNFKSIRNITFMVGNPRNFVTSKRPSPILVQWIIAMKLAVSVRQKSSFPSPAFFFGEYFHLGPKSSLDFLGKNLIKVRWGYRLCSHNISCLLCLLCHAPGLVIAGAFLF